jgi:hypothetical protein
MRDSLTLDSSETPFPVLKQPQTVESRPISPKALLRRTRTRYVTRPDSQLPWQALSTAEIPLTGRLRFPLQPRFQFSDFLRLQASIERHVTKVYQHTNGMRVHLIQRVAVPSVIVATGAELQR